MSDPRRIPANARVAAERLQGIVEAPLYRMGHIARVCIPISDLLRAPEGARDRQLLLGEAVVVYETHAGWAFVEAVRDGYVGYLPMSDIAELAEPTHRVSARTSHLYPEPDFKTRECGGLSFGSLLTVTAMASDRFAETPQGYIPRAHLAPVGNPEPDPIDVAQRLLGTPYLWGGNSSSGTDCSGLVQMACLACGIACPGDADMQEAELGTSLPEEAVLRRGDLLFWEGHVAWVVDRDTLLHANAFHMAVAFEHLQDAVNRIEAQGDGPVTARKRLEPDK